MSPYAHERPSGGFELAAWLFMRASGVALLLLALGHLAIMHLINSVDVIDYSFVARRWAMLGWRLYDLAMLLLALLHGLNGIRALIDDYVRPIVWRRLALRALTVVGAALIIVGSWAILAFQPQTSARTDGAAQHTCKEEATSDLRHSTFDSQVESQRSKVVCRSSRVTCHLPLVTRFS